MKNFKYAKTFISRLAPLDNTEGTLLPINKVFEFIITALRHTQEGGCGAPMIAAAMKVVLTRLNRRDTILRLNDLSVPVDFRMDLMDRLIAVLKAIPYKSDDEKSRITDVAGGIRQWDILLAVYYN